MPYFAVSDKIKIYYEDAGEGKTILFVHGLNSSHFELKNFIEPFKKNYRCVCYDHRCHGASEKTEKHLNIQRLGQDLAELIEYLNLKKFIVVGHSMGAATIFNYINQFGCEKIEKIVVADMSPYMRNDCWTGGIGQGKWTDEDFFADFDRIFDDVGNYAFVVSKNLINPALKNIPAEVEPAIKNFLGSSCDALTTASFWYSLFRTDQREVMKKITVPLLYLMPENPLYSTVTTDFIKNNVQDKFILAKDFPNTTHLILMEQPQLTAECVKKFIEQ